MNNEIIYNYPNIIKNIASYFPSRILIILNSILIVPLLARAINQEEMSIYLIVIQILNLICTCSSDGIGKAVLRFYEKYKLSDKLNIFFSSIIWLSIVLYGIVWILYLLFHDILATRFAISNLTTVITLILVVPCGIRQVLYQILRVKNHSVLYTFSIFMYQAIFVFLILILMNVFDLRNTNTILLSMIIAIVAIDILIISKVPLGFKPEFSFDKNILYEILKYSVPLFFTNVSYWFLINVSKFIFQNMQDYTSTSVFGLSWAFTTWIITPIVSIFIFATFPIIVKKFELHVSFKNYFTNIIQLYFLLLIPIGSVFFIYSNEITQIVLPESYSGAYILFPFFTMSMCLHELTKLINIKYHLQNKIYIELCWGVLIAAFSLFLNFYMIDRYQIAGAALALLISEAMLLLVNLLFKFKNFDYIDYKQVFKTLIFMLAISFCLYKIISIPFHNVSKYMYLLEIVIYIFSNYFVCYKLRHKILN